MFVNGVLSYEAILIAGMPQGSVSGHLLFLLLINDIADDLIGMARLFADDTSLSFPSADLKVRKSLKWRSQEIEHLG